jgi:hypothetical protein
MPCGTSGGYIGRLRPSDRRSRRGRFAAQPPKRSVPSSCEGPFRSSGVIKGPFECRRGSGRDDEVDGLQARSSRGESAASDAIKIARAALQLAASVGKSRADVLRRRKRRRSSSASDDEVDGLQARLREQLFRWDAKVLLRLGTFPFTTSTA